MVIAKQEWFVRRKYGGWGLFPKTWQGWAYLIVFLAILFGVQMLPISSNTKMIATVVLAIFLIIDTLQAMAKLKKDEREKLHEAIAERNALWAVIAVIVLGVGYQVASSVVKNNLSAIDPFLIMAIAAALIVKAISNIWLDRKD